MFTEAQKSKIADTIHEVIRDRTGMDGVGCCMAYSVVGAGVLSNLAKALFLPQGGTIQIACDPDSEWAFTMDASAGLLSLGEYHCWIAEVPRDRRVADGLQRMQAGTLTLIDFSARHYRQLMTRTVSLGGTIPQWKVEAPPAFVWTNGLPSWLYLRPERVPTNALLSEVNTFSPWIRDALGRLPRWCRPGKSPGRGGERRR